MPPVRGRQKAGLPPQRPLHMCIIAEIILPVDQHEAVPEPHQVGEKVACHSAQSRIDNHPHSRRHGGRLRPWCGFVRFHVDEWPYQADPPTVVACAVAKSMPLALTKFSIASRLKK